MTSTTLPLDGVLVLDFTQVTLGPSATQTLGDFGAEVIKVERPGSGDLIRSSYPDKAGQNNPIFLATNRNKKSIALNTKDEEGKRVVLELTKRADVVVSNFRPGVMDRMGFGYEALSRINPRIVWAQGTGFGESGPYRYKGGQDVLGQAYSGVMYRRNSPDDAIRTYPTALCDFSTGGHLVQGILLALMARDRTGRGQRVDVSLYDSMLAMQMQEACMQMNRGFEVNWGAQPLSGAFPTQDGTICVIGAFKENPLRDICTALEVGEDLSQRPEFSTPERQLEARSELQAIMRDRFATNTTEYWMQRLEAQDMLCGPVRPLAEALEDEQTAVNNMIVTLGADEDGQPVRAIGSPVHLSDTPAQMRLFPPKLGEHTQAVLDGLAGTGAERPS